MKKAIKAFKDKKREESFKGLFRSDKKEKKQPKVKGGEASQRSVAFSKNKTKRLAAFIVFSVIALSLIFNIIHFSNMKSVRDNVSDAEARIDEELKSSQSNNMIESEATTIFAKDFTETYYNVPLDSEERSKRTDELEGYFVQNFNINDLEDLGSFDGSRELTSVDLIEVETVDQDRADIHLRANYTITTYTEQEEGSGDDSEDDSEEGSEDDSDNEEKENTQRKSAEIVVPVVTNGEGFAIADAPSMTDRNMQQAMQYEEENLNGDSVSGSEENAIESFLNEFFDAYGQSKETLQFLSNENGLNNMILQNVDVQEAVQTDNGSYRIRASVDYEDEGTEVISTFEYDLKLTQENGELFVESIN